VKLIGATAMIVSLSLGYAVGLAQGSYGVYGQGNQSCGRWTDQNSGKRDSHLYTWVVGFVSGAGFASADRLRQTDSDGIAAWIDRYCSAHPLDAIAKASGALVEELTKR
jgi:hypothetical protein